MQKRLALALMFTIPVVPTALRAQADVSVSAEDTVALLQRAEGALAANRAEDAVFYTSAASLRLDYEIMLFPPKFRGGIVESVAAYQVDVEDKTELVEADNPLASLRALDRFDRWTPTIPPAYRPPWQTSRRRSSLALRRRMLRAKLTSSRHMHVVFHLLQVPAYAAQYRTDWACKYKTGTDRPDPNLCYAAEATIKQMETQAGDRRQTASGN